MRRKYWQMVWEEALHPLERSEILVSAGFAVVSVLGLLLGVGLDQRWLTVISTAVLVVAIGYSVVTIPPRVDDKLRRSALELQRALESRGNVRQKLWSLDQISREGHRLLERSRGTRQHDPEFEHDFDDWCARSLDWIEPELGIGKAARFELEAGGAAPPGEYSDFLPVARRLGARLASIRLFVEELDQQA